MKAEEARHRAAVLEALLVRVGRGFAALELAMGDRLARLEARGDGIQLGFVSASDFAREKLGLGARHARDLAALARALWRRPVLRRAVYAGAVSIEKAMLAARGSVEDEAYWAMRAATATVRQLRAELGSAAPPPEERFRKLLASLTPEDGRTVSRAIEIAGHVCGRGAATPIHRRFEAIAAEAIAGPFGVVTRSYEGYPQAAPPGTAPRFAVPPRPAAEPPLADRDAQPEPRGPTLAPCVLREVKQVEALEKELARWDELTRLRPPPQSGEKVDVDRIASELVELARLRLGWDELIGRICLLVRQAGIWRTGDRHDWARWVAARVGTTERTVRARAALEQDLRRLPELREALREGRVGYEQARLVARGATRADVKERIEHAASTSAAELRREQDGETVRKMSATGEVAVLLPDDCYETVEAGFEAVRDHLGRWEPPSRCLVIMAAHFIAVWERHADRRLRAMGAVRRRDGGLCRVPGCTREGQHVHHIVYRSQLGGDEHENLVSVCAAHHLIAIHQGYLVVEGKAPDRLVWRFPEVKPLREAAGDGGQTEEPRPAG